MRLRFGIWQPDRLHHTYAIGATGVGKTSMLETFIRQDIEAGRGVAVIEPHGDLALRVRAIAERLAPERTVYLDPSDPTQSFGYNPLRHVRYDTIPLAASGLIETLRKLWPDAWGVRMEHLLRNSLYALLEHPEARLPDLLRLYADKDYRKAIARGLKNEVVRHFWQHEFENYPDRLKIEATAPIQNKLGGFLTDPRLYRVLVAPAIDIKFRTLMDRGGIFIANLAKGRLGEDGTNVLGGLILSTISLAALTRADLPPAARRPFFVYVDEFHSFTTQAFVNMLAELRKMDVGLVLANQSLSSLDLTVRQAVLANVGTLIAFRTGAEDAAAIAREMQPVVQPEDLIALPNRHMYVKLMIDGTPSRPFSATTLPLS